MNEYSLIEETHLSHVEVVQPSIKNHNNIWQIHYGQNTCRVKIQCKVDVGFGVFYFIK